MSTCIRVYMYSCLHVYLYQRLHNLRRLRESLMAPPNNLTCQEKRQDLNVHLLKSESTDVEICLIVFVLILIDKVHHLFIGSFTLLYAGL